MGRRDKGDSKIYIPEFELESLPDSCSIGIVGAPKSGKSVLIKYMFYFFRYKYPVAKIFAGSERFNSFYSQFVESLYIHEKFDEEAENMYLSRQAESRKDKKCKNPLAINVLDDCSADRKNYNAEVIGDVVKNTSQHGCHLVVIGLQSAMDFPKQNRKCLSYVFIFNETNVTEREELYKQFGGVCGSKKNFFCLMDTICEDHRCMVIRIMEASNRLEENVFHFKVPGKYVDKKKKPFKFQFGCAEYRAWGKKRRRES